MTETIENDAHRLDVRLMFRLWKQLGGAVSKEHERLSEQAIAEGSPDDETRTQRMKQLRAVGDALLECADEITRAAKACDEKEAPVRMTATMAAVELAISAKVEIKAEDIEEIQQPINDLLVDLLFNSDRKRDETIGRVSAAIAGLSRKGGTLAGLADSAARFATASEVVDALARLRPKLLGDTNKAPPFTPLHDGMYVWDAHLANELEAFGTFGKKVADRLREASRKRCTDLDFNIPAELFKAWIWTFDSDGAPIPLGLPVLQTLAEAAWRDRVRKRIKARSGAIATLPAFVFNDLHSIAGARDVEREKTSDGRDAPPPARIYAGGSATELVLATLDGFREVTLERFHELAESPLFWPTLHWITSTVRDQEIEGRQDAHIIRIEGGDDGLRRAVAPNASKDRGAATIREILECFHLLSSAAKPGHPRLLTFIQQKIPAGPSGGRPSTLSVIEVGLLMRHNAARRLGLDVPAWFLPVFDPALIPTVGDHRTYGRQINAGQSLSLYAHEHREEIASDGSFRLTKDQWIGVANKAGLYYRTHASLRDRYLDALQEPPHPQRALAFGRVPGTEPMLVRIGPDRYRFGDSFGPEWEHFVAQGNRTLAKRRQGRDARAKRDSRLASLAEKEKRRPKG